MDFFGYDLSNSKDLLNVSLSVGFLLIAITLTLLLARAYRLLGKINTVADHIAGITDLIHHYLWQPAKIMKKVMEKVKKATGRK